MCGIGVGMPAVRRFFSFWWICTKRAFRGNTAFANDWQWFFGVPACLWLFTFVASYSGATDTTTGHPILDSFLVGLGAFIVTWTIAFIVRLLNMPAVVFHEEKDRADGLKKELDEVNYSINKPIKYVKASEAFYYLTKKSLWAAAVRNYDGSEGNFGKHEGVKIRKCVNVEVFGEFSRGAVEGQIRVLGRRGGTGAHVQIPFTDWLSMTVDHSTLVRGQISQTQPTTLGQTNFYTDLRICCEDVRRVWPQAEIVGQ